MRVAPFSNESRGNTNFNPFGGICSSCSSVEEPRVIDPVSQYVSINDLVVDLTPEEEYIFQSGEVVLSNSDDSLANHTINQNVQFLDEVSGETAGLRANPSVHSSDGTGATTALAEFLKRPVRIASYTWTEGGAAGDVIGSCRPWQLFFNDDRIKYKLHNYAFIRCNLKVKVLINASPFYYGAALLSWVPLDEWSPKYTPPSADTPPNTLVTVSQLPRLWIYPQNNEGGEMTLPFFSPRNWLRITEYDDFTEMGELGLTDFTGLDQANGVAGAGVSIQLYAWAEDVELSGSTVALAMQSGEIEFQAGKRDEYDGAVSGPASAVANAAGALTKVPVIGKFATAAQIGATAVARAASLFGFTNTPVIEPSQGFRSQPFPMMASPEISYPSEKLSLDPKNELTVDPSVAGLPNIDELSIPYLVQKESYLTQAAWLSTDPVDEILFASNVDPTSMVAAEANALAGTNVYFTPLSWLSAMFMSWRGDIIFRFKVVASQYHKGRLRVSWDPSGTAGQNIYSDAVSTTVVQTAIIDIGKDTDVEFRVPYNQIVSWLRNSNAATTEGWQVGAGPVWNMNPLYSNGALTLRVLTALTGPAASSRVPILISVRGAENLEFANPGFDSSDTWTSFQIQSGEIEFQSGDISAPEGESPQEITAGVPRSPVPERYLINFGEKVDNLRVLLHRPNLSRVWTWNGNTTNTRAYVKEYWNKLPYGPGFDPTGINDAMGYGGVTKPFNFVNMTTINWVLNAFIGVRGSTVWTLNVDAPSNVNTLFVGRNPVFSLAPQIASGAADYSNINESARWYVSHCEPHAGGFSLTNQNTQSGITVVCPNYTNFKFISTAEQYRTNPQALVDQQNYEVFYTQIEYAGVDSNVGKKPTIWYYCSAGADFTPLFFLTAPALTRLPGIPASTA